MTLHPTTKASGRGTGYHLEDDLSYATRRATRIVKTGPTIDATPGERFAPRPDAADTTHHK